MAAAFEPHDPLRGRFVDIGGRRMRIVCEGPRGNGPTVVLESGAFGFSADWAAVQARLTAEGVHSCAYDRAGLGYSDPGPDPRDGLAVASDLERLLAAADEPGPYILVGHSMAGLYVRLFTGRNPDKVRGVVLVDAATPEAQGPQMQHFLDAFGAVSRLAGWGASLGLLKPFEFAGDTIGLTGRAAEEKRRAFGDGPHNRAAADEVDHWAVTAEEARKFGLYDPDLPVAVVTAGRGPQSWKGMEAEPARRSRHGYYRNVPDAAHATVLGERFADEVVAAIDHVRAAVAQDAEPG